MGIVHPLVFHTKFAECNFRFEKAAQDFLSFPTEY